MNELTKTQNDAFEKIMEVSKRAQHFVDEYRESSGSVLISICMYCALRFIGVITNIKYGVAEYDGRQFWHMWLEYNKNVIDVGLYGISKYNSKFSKKLESPLIMVPKEEAERAGVRYFEYTQIDRSVWDSSPIRQFQGKSVIMYLNATPDCSGWDLVCDFIGIDSSPSAIGKVKTKCMYDSI